MIFASKAFFVFLPLVLLGYHLTHGRDRRYRFLLMASWLFYAWVPPHYWPVIFALTLIDYAAGLGIARSPTPVGRKRWLTASVVANLGLLFAFKYTPFAYDNAATLGGWLGVPLPARAWEIILPLGISFHTFQGISYTVDVYRGHVKAVTSFVDYAVFVSFFPQLAAGPIVRAVDFLPQMTEPPPVTRQMVADGIILFAGGLAKKLLIADHLDELFVGLVFAQPELFDAATHRWAVVAWAVQIYCDFSGYTDMAIGCALWFGFHLPPNFRLPYLATSITDFWRRWHLSLSTWLRDYVYFPMGGSRGSAARTYFNLLTLFVLCGLWHGAAWNWLAYGLYNGVLMGLHRAYERAVTGIPHWDRLRKSVPWVLLAWAATTVQFLVGLVLVRQTDWTGGLRMMRSLLGADYTPVSPGASGVPPLVPVLIALGLAGHAAGAVRAAVGVPDVRWPEMLRMAWAALLIAAVVVFAPGVAKTFIYIQF